MKPRRKIRQEKWEFCFRKRRISATVWRRTELKSRLEEAGYEAAMYFAGDDSINAGRTDSGVLQDEETEAW